MQNILITAILKFPSAISGKHAPNYDDSKGFDITAEKKARFKKYGANFKLFMEILVGQNRKVKECLY